MIDEELKNQQELYDKGWRKELAAGKEQRGNLRTNLEFITETNLLKPNDMILEIGCGIGSVVAELNEKGYDITGTDISGEAIAYGLKKYGDIKLQVQPAEDLQFEDQTFDVLLSFDLFEHIARIDKHISEVHRVLREDGFSSSRRQTNTVT